MKITTQLTIDMAKRQILEKVDAVQCDANTRAVAVTLTAGGLPWVPGDGLTVSVACEKPDRTSAWYDALPDGTAACSVAGNVVTAILAPEVLTAAGHVKAAIVFQDASLNQLATFPFIIDVAENPAAGNVISNSYYKVKTLSEINDALELHRQHITNILEDISGIDERLDGLTGSNAKLWEYMSHHIAEITRLDALTSATAIICTAKGDALAVKDSANYPLQGLTVYGKSVQNGTPTPDAPVPIVSSGAKSGTINVYALNGISDAQPVITEISYPVTVVDGEYAVFSVKAIGHDLTYLWQYRNSAGSETWHDSTSATQGYNTDTITVLANESRNGRPFRCVITDANGNTAISGEMSLILGEETVHTEHVYMDAQQITIPTSGGLRSVPVNGEDVCDCIDLMANDIERNAVKINLPTDPLKWTPVADIDGCVYYTQLEVEAAIGSGVLCAYLENGNPLATDDGVWTKNLIYVENNYLYISCCRDEYLTDVFLEERENVEMEVIYARKEPLHEQLMTAEAYEAVAELHTYKPNTTIVNDAGAGMKVEYVADPKIYIDNKFAELATAMAGS